MAATPTASRLVTAAAREALRPLGLQQRGRSRTWIDDHGWWLGIVEFQPGRNDGSYLNVGVMWLWQDRDQLAFDVGGREPGFERFVNPAQFALDAQNLARRAAGLVLENRARFIDLPSTTDFLISQKPRPGYFWDNYHAGISAGLTGDTSTARRRLDQVLAEDAFAPWMVQAQESARQLHALAEDPEAFRDWATKANTSCRQQLKLQTWEETAASGSYWS
ncbi:hypothetical protein HRW23_34790 [Streptomyces lunaelactis]|uniref:hypothetical protein n=1 Tax=Streptomyces lunaelactis TaxID=1535768 RepID=UPI00158534C1|nr:hypothetical protein [Streptomyces lunaelactis]NUK35335.1 hypothetical protein [Streptomyces lunaelactis]NUK40974.1 hypothetical protein [Streptomyces lunaelactis]NUK58831.1 hypothetical protein [Streptomyces lunaelactis]NUK82437.1 hypothetical protein [Streptomyces lunaelactis]NUK95856.1 hypothetical protein [Streptomyces lunaelactis]